MNLIEELSSGVISSANPKTDDNFVKLAGTQAKALLTINPRQDEPELTGEKARLPNGIEGTPYTIDPAVLFQGYTDPDGDQMAIKWSSVDTNLTKDDG